MAESLLDVRHLPKRDGYAQVRDQLRGLLPPDSDVIAAMATMVCVLHHGFGHLWTGFYRAVGPELLQVGPYQGSLGCMDIPFGKGVCGTAAAQGTTVVVPDVDAFPGHISCDARSRSEIVVPVFDPSRRLLAVLDIDSAAPAAFDDVDAEELEAIVAWFATPS